MQREKGGKRIVVEVVVVARSKIEILSLACYYYLFIPSVVVILARHVWRRGTRGGEG